MAPLLRYYPADKQEKVTKTSKKEEVKEVKEVKEKPTKGKKQEPKVEPVVEPEPESEPEPVKKTKGKKPEPKSEAKGKKAEPEPKVEVEEPKEKPTKGGKKVSKPIESPKKMANDENTFNQLKKEWAEVVQQLADVEKKGKELMTKRDEIDQKHHQHTPF